VRHCRLSVEALTARHAAAGLAEHYAAMLASLDDAIAAGLEDRTTSEVRQLTGRPANSLSNFLATSRALLVSAAPRSGTSIG
jgi:hypothetical protein